MNSPQVMETLEMGTSVSASPDVIFAQLGAEVSLLNNQTGVYYTLNAVGASIWQHIQKPIALTEVLRRLLTEYDVDPVRCEKDLLRIVQEMRAHELVSVSR